MDHRPSHEPSGTDPIPEPEPAHLPNNDEDDPTSPLEATELQPTSTHHSKTRILPSSPTPHWYDPIKRPWRRHVQITVPHVDCRDHLANERTFLAYLRTSAALSMLGVFIAQLWRLQHSPNPDSIFGYFIISKPLSALLQISALAIAILGCIRYFRQQAAMARGRVNAGGWEVYTIMTGSMLALLALFVLNVALDIRKSTS